MEQVDGAHQTWERLRQVDRMIQETRADNQRLNEIRQRVADMETELDEIGSAKEQGRRYGSHFEEWRNTSNDLAALKDLVEQQKAASDQTLSRLSGLRSDLVSICQNK
ncbi:hypothetical protein [Mollivirus kamchatka]|nr:hypothetical protein [Mollivirus kamchatka]